MQKITDIIPAEEIAKWKPGDNILISAPMGAGKSYFCKNTLYEVAKEEKEKILMFNHRANCVQQFAMELFKEHKHDVVDMRTYQALEQRELRREKCDLDEYKYLVCDEFHYFMDDSMFNHTTAASFKAIMNTAQAVRVFMSATGDDMSQYLKSYIGNHGLAPAKEYTLPQDFSFIGQLVFFHTETDMEGILEKSIAAGKKAIFFVQSAEKAYGLHTKFREQTVFNCGTGNILHGYVNQKKIQEILKNQRFEESALITTACFDAGINILDEDVKNIIIDLADIGSLIQCMGRRRIQGDDDKITVYIRSRDKRLISDYQNKLKKQIEMADYFIESDYSVDKLLEKFPWQNDMHNIIYDDFEYDSYGNRIPGSHTKRVNELMYFKRKKSIELYEKIKSDYGEFGYCKYLARMFGFFDETLNRYTYQIFNNTSELEIYLKRMVDDEVVLWSVPDRKELISKIAVRQDGKFLKKIEPLNDALEKRGINFRIEKFATSRMEKDSSGNLTRVPYRNAWRIINVQTSADKTQIPKIA